MANIRKQLCIEIANHLDSIASKAQYEHRCKKNELHNLEVYIKRLKQRAAEAQRMAYEFKRQANIDTANN